jgi:hypothetical protein
MRRVGGVLLEGDEITLADHLVRKGVEFLQRRNGGVPPRYLALRDRLAAEAGREVVAVVTDRGSPGAQASAVGGSAAASGAVIVSGSRSMTAQEAAALLGITDRAVRNLCQSGDLIARRGPAARWAIDAGSAEALAARRKERECPHGNGSQTG